MKIENLRHIKSKLLAEQTEEQLMNYIVNTPVAVGEKLPNMSLNWERCLAWEEVRYARR